MEEEVRGRAGVVGEAHSEALPLWAESSARSSSCGEGGVGGGRWPRTKTKERKDLR